MIYDFITEANELVKEEILTEDKQVKFGGEINPKYGWCVIYAGGPASGKSSMQNFNIPINGRKLDVDEFKAPDHKLTVKKADNISQEDTIEPGYIKKLQRGKYYKLILNSPEIAGDESKMNLNDPDYPAVAHRILDPFMDKVKNNMRTLGQYNSPDRLPNIIFDQTSKNFSKLISLIDDVKQVGYKVAIIWVLTDAAKNFEMFNKRNQEGRNLSPELFFGANPKIIDTMKRIFSSPEVLASIDDFWVVLNEYKGQNTNKQKLRQTYNTNVYHIPLEPDGLEQVHLITKNKKTNKKITHRKTIANIIDNNEKFFEESSQE